MAPAKKSRSVNKRLLNFDEVSSDKDLGNSNKGRQRKRKLSDMLGSQWSKEELERFYEAYRKYGREWKKVAAVVRNRSVEMVEALYNMNRAYLSLPEGTASVVGLIAMMTDHYNVLEGSDSERESNDASGISRKPQKRGRGNVKHSISKEDILLSRSVASSDGCLSLLKRRHSDGRAVGKRTPRFPVSYKKDDGENYVSPSQKGRKSGADANDDEVAHVAALALTEASQRGGSPQVSQMLYRRAGHMKHSQAQRREGKAKLRVTAMDQDLLEGGLGSRDAENGEYVRDSSSLMVMEGVGTVEVRRGKKFYGKKENVEDIGNTQLDDGREACSGTEEGLNMNTMKGKVDIEVANVKSVRSSPQSLRRRSKKLFGDENTAFDALLALADLSLMMPASTIESESSVQLKDEKATFDATDKLSAPEAMSPSHQKDKSRLLGSKAIHPLHGVEVATPRKSQPPKDAESDVNDSSETKVQSQFASKAWKRKRKSLSSKISAHSDPQMSEPYQTEVTAEGENKSLGKGKRSSQIYALPKQWKSVRSPERSLSNSDQRRGGTDVAASNTECPRTNQLSLPTKQRSRRKMDPQRVLIKKETNSPEKNANEQTTKYSSSLQDRAACLSEKLSCCLTSSAVRRWCTFEWFYSALDYPWFAKREFVEYLNHVGLGHTPRLTRVEWGVIRSSLGKPRRFSERFLHEEKVKLKQYRESVRMHYTQLRAGMKDGLPTDLARPLSVGQRVVALHPKTREVHDGSVLTVDHDKCRVQFDRPELGVEFVMDIDCMPSNPLENMPETLRHSVDKISISSKEPSVNGQSNIGGSMIFSPSEHPEIANGYSYLSSSNHSMNSSLKQAKGDTIQAISQAKVAAVGTANTQQAAYNQSSKTTHVQAREADVRALSELTRALDKKEELLMELRHANNDVLENRNNGDSCLKDSEPFKKHYATVLVQLKEASEQVSSAILRLRQRNTYPVNSLPPWLKQPATSNGPGGAPTSVDNLPFSSQEAGSNVVEIFKGSRSKANSMVEAAIQAISAIKEGEDAFARIGEALNSLSKRQITSDSGVSVVRSPDPVNGSLPHHNQSTSCASESLPTSHVSGLQLDNNTDKNEVQVPSELITSCVATLLMIQTCTERQYPPADVAQILDSAVSSLHPSCPQNLPIYREIQMCMGRIKTQILALIPT
ncbi:protein ALWAYS EARLY 2-like isoform X2 [Malania oleifera]|uniref:protein ALWAYS EARLY 2-like isoform X2 n=1 Tax=Malania oleifera TaxID=397392 RepID=UPI0025AE0D36|nr:protein ALWAYS EARLY 2-like isoform X2 [Malania oleifera]